MQNKLTAIQLKNSGDGKMFDGGGLSLVKKGKSGRWVYRYQHLGKRREMGLGQWPTVSLADARSTRDEWKGVLARGEDPIAVRKQGQLDQIKERDKIDPTFEDATKVVFEARKATLRDGGKAGRWLSPLELHVIPKIGKSRISDIKQVDIHDAIAPIWHSKHETAMKAITRTQIVFDKMEAMGYDCEPKRVRMAREMLGAVDTKTIPTVATDWRDIPALFKRLDTGSSVDQALRFLMLTGVRVDAAVKAEFAEIDGDIWTVPAERVKGRKNKVSDFRVPLSGTALDIIKEQSEFFVRHPFCGVRGQPVTGNSLLARLDALKELGRPHGFRTSFKTWAQDNGVSWDISETVLGHTIGGKVERAYARSDLLERRRPVMQAWADHVAGANAAKVHLLG